MARRQLEIIGTERKRIPELDKAAEEYVQVRNERMGLTKKEVERQEILVGLMQKHQLQLYEDLEADPPLEVRMKPGKVKAKVKVIGAGDEEDEADSEDEKD